MLVLFWRASGLALKRLPTAFYRLEIQYGLRRRHWDFRNMGSAAVRSIEIRCWNISMVVKFCPEIRPMCVLFRSLSLMANTWRVGRASCLQDWISPSVSLGDSSSIIISVLLGGSLRTAEKGFDGCRHGKHSWASGVSIAQAADGLHLQPVHNPMAVSFWQSSQGHFCWGSMDWVVPEVDSKF